MSRRERHEIAHAERSQLVKVFVRAFSSGGLKEAQNTLLTLKHECPQKGSQFEMAFRDTVYVAQRGSTPILA